MATPENNEYLKALRAKAKAMGGTLGRVSDTPSMLGSGLNNKYVVIISQPDYDVGDIVSFRDKRGYPVMHAITHKVPNPDKPAGMEPMGADDSVVETPPESMYFTKGTFNAHGDGYIPLSNIEGKMAKVLGPRKIPRNKSVELLIEAMK